MKQILQNAREAAKKLALLSAQERNQLLLAAAQNIYKNQEKILAANELDMQNASHLSPAMRDRLLLNSERIKMMAKGCENVAAQSEVVGVLLDEKELANGIKWRKISVGLGVVAIIYEARPNVTLDAFALAIKSANAIVLKGGSEAKNSNQAIAQILAQTCEDVANLSGAVGFLSDTSRQSTMELMCASEYIDVLIPRGGKELIAAAIAHAKVPLIATGVGNCHIYVDKSANISKSLAIILNAKLQRPSVCNAVETLLCHEQIAEQIVGHLCEHKELKLLASSDLADKFNLQTASEEDYACEFLAPCLAVRSVASLDEAIAHIERYGTKHSEAILTEDAAAAAEFAARVDAACVYHNASTRFSDGECFGLGAEIGISTQKLHARGPMGASALTGYKYLISGDYATR